MKAATPVDPGTGVSEISASALAGVAKALERAFTGLLNEGAATWQTNTGGLSQADVDTAVSQAVQQFASGQNGGSFSLRLSTVKNSVVDDSAATPGKPGLSPSYSGQDIQIISRQSTFSVTLSADGTLSSSGQTTQLLAQVGTKAESGVVGADASFDPDGLFGTHYDVTGPIATVPQVSAEPSGATGWDTTTVAASGASQTFVQLPADQGQTGDEVRDEAHQIAAVASGGYGQGGTWFAQAAALKSVTAVAEESRNATTGSLTAKLSVTTTLAVGLLAAAAKPVFLYARPDGTLGRFGAGGLNNVA